MGAGNCVVPGQAAFLALVDEPVASGGSGHGRASVCPGQRPRPSFRHPQGRDTYSFAHFPVIFGIIAFAVGLEEVVEHPADPLGSLELLLLASGVGMFVLATAGAYWRATRRVLVPRIGIIAAAGVVVGLAADATAPWILLTMLLALVTIVVVEQVLNSRGRP